MTRRKKRLHHLATAIAAALVEGHLVRGAPREQIETIVYNTLARDFAVEDEIEEEARRLMEAHQREIRSGSASFDRLFRMIKKKLAADRGVIL